MMQPVYVIGAAATAFGHHWDLSLEQLAARAVAGALSDAGAQRNRIECAYVGHMSQGELVGQRVLKELDFPEIAVLNIENACAAGATAFREAWISVGAEMADVVLVLGIEKLAQKGLMRFQVPSIEDRMGHVMPGSYALSGQRHMSEYGTTREELAWIAAKNRTNGARNPLAMFRKPATVEEVLASRAIVDPLTLLQCCAPASGAAALVLASEATAKRLGRDRVRVRSSALASRMNRGVAEDLTIYGATARAAQGAYKHAGLGPEDINVIELHDAFSIGEMLHYEGLALCGRGDSRKLVADKVTAPDGRLPVNPSGGLLARGHPVGATGVVQIVEITKQLRGEAGPLQVNSPRVGLTQCQGGTGTGAGAAVVSILSV
jgi:acetyl-CoA acetyltransferase